MDTFTSTHHETTRLMRYDAGKKSAGIAYLLWFFLGFFGAHRFYLGRTWTAMLILVCTLLAFLTLGITALVSALILFFDLFTIPSGVQHYNEKLIEQLR